MGEGYRPGGVVAGVGLLRVGLPRLQDVKAEAQSRGDEEFVIPFTELSLFCDDVFKFKCVHVAPRVYEGLVTPEDSGSKSKSPRSASLVSGTDPSSFQPRVR